MIKFPYTKHISSSIAEIGRLLYQNQIQTSAHPPLCHRWNATELTLLTKPIIYIINNSLAFRKVTSQTWKYYRIFGFVPKERSRIHEHKALVSPCERRVQNQHMVTVSSVQITAFAVLLLVLAVIKQHCITAGAPSGLGVNCLYLS